MCRHPGSELLQANQKETMIAPAPLWKIPKGRSLSCCPVVYPDRSPQAMKRMRYLLTGTVQGVGFRPFVYRLATQYGLSGFVQNSPDGVIVEVEGEEDPIARFISDVKNTLPPLADLTGIAETEIAVTGGQIFLIAGSETQGKKAGPYLPRCRHLRGLPYGTLRSRRQEISVSIHQLHKLRPQAHDYQGYTLRSGQHIHGLLPSLRRLRQGIRESPGQALSCRAERLSGVRAVPENPECRRGTDPAYRSPSENR